MARVRNNRKRKFLYNCPEYLNLDIFSIKDMLRFLAMKLTSISNELFGYFRYFVFLQLIEKLIATNLQH